MMKNDKLIVIVGVLILIIASIGIYTWVPTEATTETSDIETFFDISSSVANLPDAIEVCDSSPFYALIATPVAVHYDEEYNQHIIPLYIENKYEPSSAVTRAMDQIPRTVNSYIDDTKTAKEWSLDFAKKYWTQSDAALIIKENESGYNLGVMATPIASYLRIPVIVTDEMDYQVREVLTDLGVKKTLVCGENLTGYGTVFEFNSMEEIVDATMDLIKHMFGNIDYITITNPIDAWPPEVLDSEEFTLGPKTMTTKASTQLLKAIRGSDSVVGTFTIPKDYKYALVKLKCINLNTEYVDELGDNVIFACGPVTGEIEDAPSGLEMFEILAGGTSGGGIPVRDSNGNIIEDICYTEAVLYDRDGVEYEVTANPNWLVSSEGEVKVEVVVEKLSDPIYPMMKGLSAIAPYLTAYHKGLIFGKPGFAFAADDDVLYMGEPSPGFYMSRRNPQLTGPSNDHVFEIHDEINELLAKLADVPLEKEYDIKNLQNYYKESPVYIALVGGATVLPQIIYDSPIDPVSPPEEVAYYFGGGVPSDFIYGNIDPNPGDWSSQAPDMYSDYPYQENIVGRITGWDAQDASALVARTVFYEDIIDDLGDWKDNAVLQMGGGNDFQKPFIRYKIFGELLNIIRRGEPMKMETGASYFTGLGLKNDVFEPMGFNIEYMRENEATYKGFSNEAIDLLKNANVLNKLLLSKRQIKNELGVDVVSGKEQQENSNFILSNAHGNQHMFGMGDVGMYKLGLGLPHGILPRILEKVATIMGYGPGLSLSDHGYYSTRNVENMDLGPSFIWIESCICGKIDGVYPKQGVSQAYLHAGANCVIASTTSSNVPGGYLEPKRTKYDFPGQTAFRLAKATVDALRGEYPEQHFGFKIYSDLCEYLDENEGMSLGEAYRNARNDYLPEDASWEVWWSPPLIYTGYNDIDTQLSMAGQGSEGLDPRLDNKYMSFQEYALYGDPAFTPYIP